MSSEETSSMSENEFLKKATNNTWGKDTAALRHKVPFEFSEFIQAATV